MHKLQFVDGSRDSVWLVEPKMTIGKNAANDLVLDGPNVTDFHAEIRVDHDHLYLINLNARNLCKVNGRLVPASTPLSTNDVVQFDQVTLRVIDPKSDSRQRPVAAANSVAAANMTMDGWYLEGNASWMPFKQFPLKGSMVIGRDSDCELSLPVSTLSRRHAQVVVREGYLDIKDLGSTNGTFVNGERIIEGRAKSGDKIRLDVVQFTLHGPLVKDEANANVVPFDGDRTVLRRAASAAAPVTATPKAETKPAWVAKPVPNLMTAASKPAPKLSSADDFARKNLWPYIVGGFLILVGGFTALFLLS